MRVMAFQLKHEIHLILPIETEILRETRTLGSHKAPGSDGLPLVLFRDGGMKMVREIQVCS